MARQRRIGIALALCGAVGIMLSACSGQGPGNQNPGSADATAGAIAKGESGDTYTAPKVSDIGKISVSIDKPFSTYNNAVASAGESYNSFALIQVLARPFVLDGNNKVLLNKDVMDSVDVTSTNPQVVTWKIKKGVKWSDGKPWGCKDFYLAWLAQSGQDLKPDKSTYFQPATTTGYSQINSAKCLDDQTFVTTFQTPFADYKSLFGLSDDLLPAHVLEEHTGISDITQVTPTSPPATVAKVADFWNNGWNGFNPSVALASGPYRIDSVVPQESVTLTRNPEWGGNSPGPASIQLKAVSDPTAQVQALQNNEEQVLSSTQPDGNASAALRGLAGITYGASPGLNFEHIDLNLNRPLFKDLAVRKAIASCINRDELIDKLVKPIQDSAKPLNSVLFFPGADGYQDDYSAKMPDNADTAKQILQADGWSLGTDNIFTKGGQRLSFTIGHTDTPRRKQTVELVRNECAKAGIDVRDNTDPNFLDDPLHSGNFDAALYGSSVQPFHSSIIGVYQTNGGQNFQGLSDQKIDDAFTMATKQAEQSSAIPFYQQAGKAIADTYATFPLFQVPNVWAYRGVDRVYFQSYFGSLWDANEWQKSTK